MSGGIAIGVLEEQTLVGIELAEPRLRGLGAIGQQRIDVDCITTIIYVLFNDVANTVDKHNIRLQRSNRPLYQVEAHFICRLYKFAVAVLHIGDGAIIGANSVVGSDVDPYTIVVGNPAKLLRKRFDDELIDLMLRFQWWDLWNLYHFRLSC